MRALVVAFFVTIVAAIVGGAATASATPDAARKHDRCTKVKGHRGSHQKAKGHHRSQQKEKTRHRKRRLCIGLGAAGAERADFNGDGFTDMAIGAPLEDVPEGGDEVFNAGAVHVIYGTASGPSETTPREPELLFQLGAGEREADDQYGFSLAAGDFNDDGFDDLAVGAPLEDVGAATDTGRVDVRYGSPSGLGQGGAGLPDQVIDQAASEGTNGTGDRFGAALAWGRFDVGSQADLAIGAPGKSAGAGEVTVVYAINANGLDLTATQHWSQNSTDIEGASEAGDSFGTTLTAGNLGRSSSDELVVGVPFEDVADKDDGAVNVIYGTTFGLAQFDDQAWHQDSILANVTIADATEPLDRFGSALAVGDIDADGTGDLLVGVPLEDLVSATDGSDRANAGAIHLLRGSAGAGLLASGNQFFHQDTPGIVDLADAGDQFGFALAANEIGGGGGEDVAVGVPFEDSPAAINVGGVHLIQGAAGMGLSTNDAFLNQAAGGDPLEAGDLFGSTISAWRLNGDAGADLIVGAPFEDTGGALDAGMVNVLFSGSAFGQVAGSQVWTQGDPALPGNGAKDAPEPVDHFGAAIY